MSSAAMNDDDSETVIDDGARMNDDNSETVIDDGSPSGANSSFTKYLGVKISFCLREQI